MAAAPGEGQAMDPLIDRISLAFGATNQASPIKRANQMRTGTTPRRGKVSVLIL